MGLEIGDVFVCLEIGDGGFRIRYYDLKSLANPANIMLIN